MFNTKLPHMMQEPEAPEEFTTVEREMAKMYNATHPDTPQVEEPKDDKEKSD
jgi:hypothetical protein